MEKQLPDLILSSGVSRAGGVPCNPWLSRSVGWARCCAARQDPPGSPPTAGGGEE